MAAIKVLNQYFGESRKIWMLVERKARKFLLQKKSLDRAAFDKALDSFVVSLVDIEV